MRKDFLQSDICSKCGEEVLKELIISGRLQQFEADNFISAGMAELADAPDLGSGVTDVQVQVLLPAFEKWLRINISEMACCISCCTAPKSSYLLFGS